MKHGMPRCSTAGIALSSRRHADAAVWVAAVFPRLCCVTVSRASIFASVVEYTRHHVIGAMSRAWVTRLPPVRVCLTRSAIQLRCRPRLFSISPVSFKSERGKMQKYETRSIFRTRTHFRASHHRTSRIFALPRLSISDFNRKVKEHARQRGLAISATSNTLRSKPHTRILNHGKSQ